MHDVWQQRPSVNWYINMAVYMPRTFVYVEEFGSIVFAWFLQWMILNNELRLHVNKYNVI